MKSAADEEVVFTQDEPYSVRLASKYAPAPPGAPYEERRQYSRRRDRELDWVRTTRLKSGGGVTLIDLSAGGVQFDTEVPLRPGSSLSLEIVGGGIEVVVPIHVLRSQISALRSDSARYRGACEFAKPIELPDLTPLGELVTASSSDPFVGVDAALKRLVERAYAADKSQRLAAGDVLLVLQSLSRRALTGDPDPFGQQVGNMLHELLPALRHGHGAAAVLAAIERQLRHALPDARLRVADGSTSAPAGSRSVLVSFPGNVSASRAVSIDLPATVIVSDAQARLLRTSSRLIALIQCLNLSPNSAAPRAMEGEHPATSAAWQKVVVRYADGQMLKGFTHDFHGSKSQFSVWPSPTAPAHERVVVPFARLKAVFFVREFGGNPDHIEQKVFESPAHGRRIEVTLLDNEVLVGTTLNYRPGGTGFFISPADPRANNLRVFIVSSAVRQVRFP